MFRNGNIFKQWVNRLPEKHIFIFDLDKTLWNCTIDHNANITPKDIYDHCPKERHYMLTHIQEKGHELNISSRSNEPDKCKVLLRYLFPNITFNNIQIFPTPKTKREHVSNIINGRDINNFIVFDEEIHILEDLKKIYPGCQVFHTINGLRYETFEKT